VRPLLCHGGSDPGAGGRLHVFAAYKTPVRQIERKQAAQEAVARQLIESQEGERKRIAAEIHDGLGQTLAIIKNRALLGQTTSTDLVSAREQFELIAAQSTQAIDEAKDISYNLSPYLLDRLGLTQALVSMIGKVADLRVYAHDRIAELDGLFAPDEGINLYRIVQECLNNIVKHSGASAATVRLQCEQDWVELIVNDNGKGFLIADWGLWIATSPDQRAPSNPESPIRNAQSGGFGLMGIRALSLLRRRLTIPRQAKARRLPSGSPPGAHKEVTAMSNEIRIVIADDLRPPGIAPDHRSRRRLEDCRRDGDGSPFARLSSNNR
jgi:two-component sensor histidine kinase